MRIQIRKLFGAAFVAAVAVGVTLSSLSSNPAMGQEDARTKLSDLISTANKVAEVLEANDQLGSVDRDLFERQFVLDLVERLHQSVIAQEVSLLLKKPTNASPGHDSDQPLEGTTTKETNASASPSYQELLADAVLIKEGNMKATRDRIAEQPTNQSPPEKPTDDAARKPRTGHYVFVQTQTELLSAVNAIKDR